MKTEKPDNKKNTKINREKTQNSEARLRFSLFLEAHDVLFPFFRGSTDCVSPRNKVVLLAISTTVLFPFHVEAQLYFSRKQICASEECKYMLPRETQICFVKNKISKT